MFLVLTLSAALLAPPALPQTISERARANLRLIDVVVTDKSGAPIRGLRAEDFVVTVDGKPRRVLSVDTATSTPTVVPTAITEPGDATANLAPQIVHQELEERPERWTVILLDADRTPTNYRKIVMDTARAVAQEAAKSGNDRVAVAMLKQGELSFVREFVPAAELDLTVFDNPGSMLLPVPDLRYRLDEMAELVQECAGRPGIDNCVLLRSEEFLWQMRREAETGVAALRGLIAALSPLPGRKALVWFTNGVVLQPGQVVTDTVVRYVADPRFLESRLNDFNVYDYDKLVDEAMEARVTLFALRAGIGTAHALRGADRATVDRQLAGHGANPYRLTNTLAQQSMRDVAEATGGKVVFTPLKPKVAEGLLDHMDGIYSLGLEVLPTDTRRARIKIKLADNKKAKVSVQRRLGRRSAQSPPLTATLEPDPLGALLTVDLEAVETEEASQRAPATSRLAVYVHVRTDDGKIVLPYYQILEVPRGDHKVFHHRLTFAPPTVNHVVEAFVTDLVGGGQAAVQLDSGTGSE